VRTTQLLPILFIFLILPILVVGAQESGGDTRVVAGPHLAGIVELSSLSLLWSDSDNPSGDPAGRQSVDAPEPLDIAWTADGPVLLFSDRILSLGFNLEMTTRTVQDLIALPRLPQGVVPSRLLLNPLSEPIIYDGRIGTIDLLHRDGSDPERFETQLPGSLEVAGLRRGGVVLSDGKSLTLFTRRANELARREITLPVVFTTGLSIDDKDRLWVYDLAARRVRVFDPSGEELFSVTPDISGGTLLFPQVFQARADGGFFLGTAGELWCFDADGSVRWRLSQFSTGFRQALPAFYRLAAAAQAAGGRVGAGRVGAGSRSFYILDPLGNRILKFVEDLPSGSPVNAQGIETIDTALASAFRSSETQHSRQNEILRLCLEKGLYLQAAFFRRSGRDEPVVTDLAERLRAKQAGLLAELGEQLENELRYTEAETAYNHSLSLYRELRNLDPVDPRYPRAIRELSDRRNALREIRVAERLLAARIVDSGLKVGGGKQELGIVLTNTSAVSIEQVEVLASFSGYTASRWQAILGAIHSGGTVTLTITLSEGSLTGRGASEQLNAEDLYIPCNLLVRYVHNHEKAAEHFRIPVVFPTGTLRLATTR
jgi:hypothetical protein